MHEYRVCTWYLDVLAMCLVDNNTVCLEACYYRAFVSRDDASARTLGVLNVDGWKKQF